MRLINNRYKLDKMIYDTLDSSLYQGFDLWDNDSELYIKFYNSERRGDIIDYFIENFISISKIRHKNLLSSFEFNIINNIDSKRVNMQQYFSTTEYVEAPTLDQVYSNLNLRERLNILIQIANVLDFLHYKGIVYRYLSPTNIYILENGNVKLKDLVTIHENMLKTEYDDLTRNFIASEVLLKRKDIIAEKADKYSFGMLALYLLTRNFENAYRNQYEYLKEFQLDISQEEFLNEIIKSCIMENPKLRDLELRDIIDRLNKKFNMDFQYDLVKERGILDFQTKIVGREKEIEKVLHMDKLIASGDMDRKIILVRGNKGTGKTRLLKEISHLLRLKGRNVYNTKISPNDRKGLNPMTNILRMIVKDAPKSILDKYVQELSAIVPELKYTLEIDKPIVLEGHREKLRVFDRTTNFLKEIFQNQPTYLVLDNLENCSVQLLYMIDYLMNNIGKGKINIIASYNEKLISENSEKHSIILKWLEDEIVDEIETTNFNLEEIGQCIQYILGISYRPLKFSAVILKESQGNPKFIEYIIKDLYANGELYLSPQGHWEVKSKKFSDIYFSTNFDEAVDQQLNLIKDEYKGVMEIISVYSDAVSKNTLQSILNIESDSLNTILKELVSMKLLDMGVSDLGYSYSINDIQLKRAIYYKIPDKKRVELHKKIANYLEEIYIQNYESILGELIHHLMWSNQKSKALKLIVEKAREEDLYSFQSIVFWEEAYEIDGELESEYALEILEKLGQIYSTKGENDNALDIYEKLLEKAKEQNKIEYAIIANNGIADIYLKKSFLDLAVEKVEESEKLSKEIKSLDLLVESKISKNKVLLNKGEFKQVENNMNQLLGLVLKEGLAKHLGDIYNLLGLAQFYKGNMAKALKRFKKSIEAFENTNDLINSTKPRNNIANIYTQYGDNEKAMKYYEKCLDIVKDKEISNLKLVLLNNIGSIYMSLYQYNKAIEYMESARVHATEAEEADIELLTNGNLSRIYLLTGDYEQSYNYYAISKEIMNGKNYSFDMMGYYYNYLSEFYLAFGKFQEAKRYSKLAVKNLKDFSINEYLGSKARILLIDYFANNIYDKKSMEEIRAEYRDENIDLDRRYTLLNLALVSLMEKDYEYLRKILDEDRELSKKHSIPKLDYFRGILVNATKEDEEGIRGLIELEARMKIHNLPQLDLMLNMVLGMKFSRQGKYYEGISYLLEALDIIYGLVRNIPSRDFQKGLVKRFCGDTIKQEVNQMLFALTNKEINTTFIEEIKPNESLGKYFDYRPLIALLDDKDFAKIREVSIYVDEDIKDIENLDGLISSLSSDYKANLELILKFLAKETFATKAYILGYDEDTNRYLPVVSLAGNNNWIPNENLLSLANRYKDGILINGNVSQRDIEFYSGFLSKNTKALMCVPIEVKTPDTIYKGKDRRKNTYSSRVNEGYIYLETERVFNRFDSVRHQLAYTLTQIIYMNLENYKLKILSNIDKLTGISTRKYFEQEYKRIFNDTRAGQGSFAVLMLDIDNFKEVNDKYGHRKGDKVLSRIGKILRDNIRSTDLAARYGGEEFIIVLKNISKEKAEEIGEKIRTDVEKLRLPAIRDTITISVGIAMFPLHGQFKEELIEKADQALYNAKEEGKNKVRIWDAHLLSTFERIDSLAGIVSGNIDQDQDNVLAILNTIDLVKEDISREEKIFKFLGRLIKTIDAETGTIICLDVDKNPTKTYSRTRESVQWEEEVFINYSIIKNVVEENRGKFLIDWDSINDVDLTLRSPNWKSTIAYPIEFSGEIRGVLYATVPLKEKEFDYDCYNIAKTLGRILSPIL